MDRNRKMQEMNQRRIPHHFLLLKKLELFVCEMCDPTVSLLLLLHLSMCVIWDYIYFIIHLLDCFECLNLMFADDLRFYYCISPVSVCTAKMQDYFNSLMALCVILNGFKLNKSECCHVIPL